MTGRKWGMGHMPVVLALRRLRQEDACKFEASMGYRVKLCFKIQSNGVHVSVHRVVAEHA